MTGISTPRRNVPLRTTTSWKQTPQAATAILISCGPTSHGATSATRKTSGGPVLSATTARISSSASLIRRRKPAGDDLPHAALGLHDRARKRAGMLVGGEGQRRHQPGVVVLHAFQRGDDRGLIGLAAGALERLGGQLAGLIAVHAVGGRLGVMLVFLLGGEERLYRRLAGIKRLHHRDCDRAFRQGTRELEGLGIAERVVAAELRLPAGFVGLAQPKPRVLWEAEEP